jgi:hypothetical protein
MNFLGRWRNGDGGGGDCPRAGKDLNYRRLARLYGGVCQARARERHHQCGGKEQCFFHKFICGLRIHFYTASDGFGQFFPQKKAAVLAAAG